MKRPFPWLALMLLAGPAAAQPDDWSRAAPTEVRLSSFKFGPSSIRLRAGQPATLRLVNTSSGGHNLSAPEFFAAARVRDEDAALVARGRIEVPARAVRQVMLVPTAGQYRLKCTHAFHGAFGMKGKIIVE